MGPAPNYLPELQAQWRVQLNLLNTANRDARARVDDIQRQIFEDPSRQSSLQPQLDQARLAQIQAAQRYNSFIESGSDLIKVAVDAEQRLKSPNMSALERHQ